MDQLFSESAVGALVKLLKTFNNNNSVLYNVHVTVAAGKTTNSCDIFTYILKHRTYMICYAYFISEREIADPQRVKIRKIMAQVCR